MLPAKGPWPHPYYDLPDELVEVSFDAPERTVAEIVGFDAARGAA